MRLRTLHTREVPINCCEIILWYNSINLIHEIKEASCCVGIPASISKLSPEDGQIVAESRVTNTKTPLRVTGIVIKQYCPSQHHSIDNKHQRQEEVGDHGLPESAGGVHAFDYHCPVLLKP